MRKLPLIALAGMCCAAQAGPLGVRLRCDRDNFLVYEPISIQVTIQNYSGRTVRLEESEQASWLSFVITGDGNNVLPPVKQPGMQPVFEIPPRESVSRTIDLVPLYELRERGNYRVQAVVTALGSSVASAPLRLSLTNGRELWSRVVGLPPVGSGPDEYRTYSLLARRGEHEDSLYVSVADEQRQVVYSLVSLGDFFSTTTPQVLIDGEANLHILFQNGPRSFGYAGIDPSAKVFRREAYSDLRTRPRLMSDEGKISVVGGERTFPRPEHVFVDEPEPPAAPPKKARHWWWPFGAHSSH